MICASIKEKSLKKVLYKLKKVPKEYDLVEIWLDQIKNFKEEMIKKIVGSIDKDLLFVMKSKDEKGNFKGSDKEKFEILMKAAEYGVKYVDINIDSDEKYIRILVKEFKNNRSKVIISYHNFTKTPSLENLKKNVAKARKLGADIVKVVPLCKSSKDNLVILEFLFAESKKGAMISFCMGKKGRLSRLMSYQYGSKVHFVAPDETWMTAEGQFTLKEWKEWVSKLDK
jgi:3-dehydroquinate dehydratase-1